MLKKLSALARRFGRAIVFLFTEATSTAAITPHKNLSQTVLLSRIAAAFLLLTGRFAPFKSESKTYLLQVIAGRLSAGVEALAFVSVGDTNGFCYYLGTNRGTAAWVNPHTAGYMTCIMSSIFTGGMGPDKVVDRAVADNLTGNVDGSWVAFDFGVGNRVIPSTYIGRGRSDGSQSIKNWLLQGSNNVASNDVAGINAATWTTLDTRANDTTMPNSGVNPWAVYTVPATTGQYRWLRIIGTAGNQSGTFILVAVEWEFYGSFYHA